MMFSEEAKKIIVGDDYDDLKRFLADALEARYDYKVLMGRKCINVAYAMGLLGNNNSVVTDDWGILAYVDEMANYYVKYGRIPRILIVSCVIRHGRALQRALYRLEESVFLRVKQMMREALNRRDLRLAMLSAISIRSFILSDGADLICNGVCGSYLFSGGRPLRRYAGSLLFQFDRDISSLEYFCGSTPAGCLLSIDLGEGAVNSSIYTETPEGWLRSAWIYNGWREVGLARNNSLVHLSYRGCVDELAHIFATGLYPMTTITRKELEAICNKLAQFLDDGVLKNTVMSKGEEMMAWRARFVMFVASAAVLREYCDAIGLDWTDALGASNLYEVCRGFGRPADVFAELEALLCSEDAMDELADQLLRAENLSSYNDDSISIDDNLIVQIEDEFTRLVLKNECLAWEYSRNRRTFIPGECENVLTLHELEPLSKNRMTMVDCLMALTIHNVVSPWPHLTDDGIEWLFGAGVMAIQTFPERHIYLSAAIYRMKCWSFGETEFLKRVDRFVQLLEWDENYPVSKEMINNIKIMLPEFVRFSLKAGISLSCWGELKYSGGGGNKKEHLSFSELNKTFKFFKKIAVEINKYYRRY